MSKRSRRKGTPASHLMRHRPGPPPAADEPTQDADPDAPELAAPPPEAAPPNWPRDLAIIGVLAIIAGAFAGYQSVDVGLGLTIAGAVGLGGASFLFLFRPPKAHGRGGHGASIDFGTAERDRQPDAAPPRGPANRKERRQARREQQP